MQLIELNELIELSDPNFSKKSIFVFPEGSLPGINLENLINYKEIFSYKLLYELLLIIRL